MAKKLPRYNISVCKKDYDPSNNAQFKTKEIKISELNDIVTKNNYSLITWKNGYRLIENFEYAVGCSIDIDDNLTINKAIDRLNKNNMNYFLVTSKSHTPSQHKYHILIMFQYPVYSLETYKDIIKNLLVLFPEGDTNATDPARFFFGSPDDCTIHSCRSKEDYDSTKHGGLWDLNTKLYDKDDNLVLIQEGLEKTPIKCPFHNDESPSAFVNLNKDKYFIHCSSCDKTFWMYESNEDHFSRVCNHYYSYGTDIWEFGITNEEFSYSKIGRAKFHAFTDTDSSQRQKDKAFKWLCKNKHIKLLSRIDYVGDINISESKYEVDLKQGIIIVKYRAIQPNIKDNQYIEDYLEDRFGEYKDFIKQWLAAYCYTNYVKLPTLIFNGVRSLGKTTFIEWVSKIYPSLSDSWGGKKENFTYEAEKKFLRVDENVGDKVEQYDSLKEYTGNDLNKVHKKFKDPYKVLNNMNFAITSNDVIPIFVKKPELPKDEFTNQFFVYEFPPFTKKMDPGIKYKLEERLGYYIRTELAKVFKSINLLDSRYGVKCPITSYEIALFSNNTTTQEQDVEFLISDLTDIYAAPLAIRGVSNSFIRKGYLPVEWLKENFPKNNKVVKTMIRLRLIDGQTERKTVDGTKRLVYIMRSELLDILKKG